MNIQNYEEWHNIKTEINTQEILDNFYFYEKEIWWCAIGLNIGTEINGKDEKFQRPVLIIKKFNKYQFWGVALTSTKKESVYYEKINYYTNTNKEIKSFVNLSQMRNYSSKRLIRKINAIDNNNYVKIKNKIIEILN